MSSRWQRLAIVIVLVCISLWTASAQSNDTTPANSTQPPSFCEICRDKGDCHLANAGQSPGQFCYNWLDRASQRRACCCPQTAYCLKSTSQYECKCTNTNPASNNNNSHSNTKSSSDMSYIWIGLGVGILGFCIGGAVYMCMCKKRNNGTPTAQPVYGHGPPVYANGGYAHQGYGYGYRGGYNDGPGIGTGLAVGAVGGLVLGEMLADAGDHGGGFGGDYGGGDYGGGGGDFGGGDGGFAGDF